MSMPQAASEQMAVMKKAAGFLTKTWKDRCLVLCFDELRYFRDESPNPESDTPSGIVHLQDSVCEFDDADPTDDSKPYVNDGTQWKVTCMEGDDHDKRHVYHFQSSSTDEAKLWVESVNLRINYSKEFPLSMVCKVLDSGRLALICFVLFGHWSQYTALFVHEMKPFFETNVNNMAKGVRKNDAVYSKDFGQSFTRHYRFHNNYFFGCITARSMSTNRVAEFLGEVQLYVAGQKMHSMWDSHKREQLAHIAGATPNALDDIHPRGYEAPTRAKLDFNHATCAGIAEACAATFDVMRLFSPNYNKHEVLTAFD